ncbi:MAG: DUF4191 domain-containing protein [Actinomycetota bacterium]|nr:DUF4191 domain-containing protein [Actinomycetota bacterium]
MAKGSTAVKKQGTFRKLIQAFKITKQNDKYVGWICLAWFLGVGLIVGALVWLVLGRSLGSLLAAVLIGIPAGLLASVVVFGRRAEKSAYAQIEGRPGAAAAALGVLRRGWTVQTAVAVTKNQDLVHRVVGRPGVILIGEGNPARLRHLLGVEKKKHARVVGETPIYDVVVGDDAGSVPIKQLSKHVTKLPKKIQPAEVTDLLQRLKALDAMRPQIPVPKGPMPNTKQARQSMRGR